MMLTVCSCVCGSFIGDVEGYDDGLHSEGITVVVRGRCGRKK